MSWVSALGGGVGIAAIITALASLITLSRRAKATETAASSAAQAANSAAAQLTPNHGSTVSDAINRIEKMVSSQGHQIGEIRRDAAVTHEMIADRLSEHGDQITRLYELYGKPRNKP
ncbi:Uncharacterised protein [Actinobaculum suis]|uniref:Uncharacterized protein n=1 Tax=Actinobaculum suis TaxID=1657 RepID=A0A7Z8Y9Q6_9ACTO|nr:hypothetical protein [Actinobaculum suis]VDG76904.1 Uncharacterised protein [Actinobaculum suis]